MSVAIVGDVLYVNLRNEMLSGTKHFKFDYDIQEDGRVFLQVLNSDNIIMDHNYIDDTMLILMKAKWDVVSDAVEQGHDVHDLFKDSTDNSEMIEPYDKQFTEKTKKYKLICEAHLKQEIEISGLE